MRFSCFSLMFLGFTLPAQAALNDIYPGDYAAAPAGTNALALYGYDRVLKGSYSQGINQNTLKREANTLVVLGARYFDIHSMRSMVSASVGKTKQKSFDLTGATASPQEISGKTDAKFSFGFWPVLVSDQYSLAVNLAHVLPTGDYSPEASQNIGQNRARTALSFGWWHRLNTALVAEATVELARYSTNTSYQSATGTQSQGNTEALTLFLSYKSRGVVTPYAGYQWNWGGSYSTNGQPYGPPDRFSRSYLGIKISTTKNSGLHIRLSRDENKYSGMKLNQELAVKTTLLF